MTTIQGHEIKTKQVLAILIIILTAGLTTLYIMSETPGIEGSQASEAPTSENQAGNSLTISEEDVQGEIVSIEIEGMTADPSRPQISEEDAIRFDNNEEHEIEINFDRNYDEVRIDSQDSMILDFNRITYYTVSASGQDSYRNIERGINVQ